MYISQLAIKDYAIIFTCDYPSRTPPLGSWAKGPGDKSFNSMFDSILRIPSLVYKKNIIEVGSTESLDFLWGEGEA